MTTFERQGVRSGIVLDLDTPAGAVDLAKKPEILIKRYMKFADGPRPTSEIVAGTTDHKTHAVLYRLSIYNVLKEVHDNPDVPDFTASEISPDKVNLGLFDIYGEDLARRTLAWTLVARRLSFPIPDHKADFHNLAGALGHELSDSDIRSPLEKSIRAELSRSGDRHLP